MSVSSDSSVLFLDEIFSKIGFGLFHICVIIILGFIHFYDAVEMILLGFLGPVLNCSWKINLWESSAITIAVFIGMSFGALIFGKLGDTYGRKTIIMICLCGIFYFSLLCAASPTFVWVLITRSLIGVFIGGAISMIFPFLAEIMPIHQRGSALLCVQSFWPIGSLYITLLTFSLVPTIGWRWWLCVSVAPMLFVVFAAIWLPESPRYLLLMNRKVEAIKIINRIAAMNSAESIINIKNQRYNTASLMDVFHRNYALTTVVTMYIWFVSGASYYGFVLASPIINQMPHSCLQNLSAIFDPSIFISSSADTSCCVALSNSNMKTVLISIAGELVSYLIAIFLIRFIKRKLYIQILLLIISLVYFLMNLCLSPSNMGILMMFGRGAALALYGVSYLYASEVFPTTVRGYAIGIGNGFSRIGAMLSSVIVNIVLNTSFFGGTMFYCSINIIAFLLVFFLPYETKDRTLLQSVDQDIPEFHSMK